MLGRIKKNSLADITENWIMDFAEEHPEFSIEDIRYVLLVLQERNHTSWDAPLSYDIDNTLANIFPDGKTDIERDITYREDLRKTYNWIMKEATKKNNPLLFKTIITKIIFSESPQAGDEVADQLEISTGHVRNTKMKILKMIRAKFKYTEGDLIATQ